jgi:hypothetical protein
MSIIQGTAKGGSASFYDFPIGDSLRFDGSSYLSRTSVTPTDAKKFSISFWVKRSTLSDAQTIFILGNTINDSGLIIFEDSTRANQLAFIELVGGSYSVQYSDVRVFRDTSSFTHFLLVGDTTASSMLSLYVNGNLMQSTTRDPNMNNDPTPNDSFEFNKGSRQNIIGGRYFGSLTVPFKGYLANIQFIDGQALDASYFGETKQDIWVPKTFDGTSSTGGSTVSTDYGTNGFLLDFSSISGTTINDTAPIDTNHSSANNWTATGF